MYTHIYCYVKVTLARPLDGFVCCKRLSNLHEDPIAIPADEETERILRECRPNPSNKSHLLQECRTHGKPDGHESRTNIQQSLISVIDIQDDKIWRMQCVVLYTCIIFRMFVVGVCARSGN